MTKPDTLISTYLYKDGCFCAVGYLANQLGVPVVLLDSKYVITIHGKHISKWLSEELADQGISVSENQISNLMLTNDASAYKVENFVNFCKEVGIELMHSKKSTDCTGKDAPPHTCPYQSDVNDDNEFLCTCCEECEYECMMDI